jgi:hypothetical protein
LVWKQTIWQPCGNFFAVRIAIHNVFFTIVHFDREQLIPSETDGCLSCAQGLWQEPPSDWAWHCLHDKKSVRHTSGCSLNIPVSFFVGPSGQQNIPNYSDLKVGTRGWLSEKGHLKKNQGDVACTANFGKSFLGEGLIMQIRFEQLKNGTYVTNYVPKIGKCIHPLYSI